MLQCVHLLFKNHICVIHTCIHLYIFPYVIPTPEYKDGNPYRHASVVTVDVKANDHWTDLKCGLLDTQLDETVRAVKDRFVAAKSKNNYNSSDNNNNSHKRKI